MFNLTEKESQKANEWKEQHSKEHVLNYEGAIGGRWSYIFTPTTLGIAIKIKCFCGKEKDITSYDTW